MEEEGNWLSYLDPCTVSSQFIVFRIDSSDIHANHVSFLVSTQTFTIEAKISWHASGKNIFLCRDARVKREFRALGEIF